MSKIVDYHVLKLHLPEDLVKDMKEAIAEGWQPFGSLAIRCDTFDVVCYIQAIVKYESDDKPKREPHKSKMDYE